MWQIGLGGLSNFMGSNWGFSQLSKIFLIVKNIKILCRSTPGGPALNQHFKNLDPNQFKNKSCVHLLKCTKEHKKTEMQDRRPVSLFIGTGRPARHNVVKTGVGAVLQSSYAHGCLAADFA